MGRRFSRRPIALSSAAHGSRDTYGIQQVGTLLADLLSCGAAPVAGLTPLACQLSLLYHLDHGQSLAVLLPALLAEYADQHPRQLLRYAGQVWGLHRGAPQQRVSAAIGATAGFFQRMGLATRLSAHGLDAEAVAEILAQLQRRDSRGEPPGIDFQASERILLRAL